ncbi:CvpA family protein [Candidatus Uhrbacteria bacterium]|nr:CvpA family protein [Candidatus Uhrbacteria bacterium]MBI4598938.1 CvpA family protein [Candidatus Uhrbacteria bacterium]
MPPIDLVLGVVIGAFVLFGLFFGFVHTLGSLVGSIAGGVIAARLLDPAVAMLGFVFGGNESVAKVVLFFLLFFFVSRGIGILFWIAGKLFGFLKIIPFAKTANRLAGGVLGFLEGVVVVGVLVYFATTFLPPDFFLRVWIEGSTLVTPYVKSVIEAGQDLLALYAPAA